MAYRIPFQERKTPWRGLQDLATGCYPSFLFGGSTDKILPVFHFHDVTPRYLEPYLTYLTESGYQTVTSEAIADFALKGVHPGSNRVALAFDDAWLSLWTVAFPLLKKYSLSAIAYVSPGRVPDADRPRPALQNSGGQLSAGDAERFASWPELKALHESGIVDIQAHTYGHSTVFCDDKVTGFVTPDYGPPIHLRPLLNEADSNRYVSPGDLGCPLYAQRSRMSDALRYLESVEARRQCVDLVRRQGGTAFFARPDWESMLKVAAQTGTGRFETAEEQREAIRNELVRAREKLTQRLGSHSVRHICFPFSVCGDLAESLLKETGYETAFADRLFGLRAVKAGGNPYRLMRLKHEFIFCLPGKGRRGFVEAWRQAKRKAAAE